MSAHPHLAGAWMSSIRTLILEIHRRSLWQVAGVYAVASWLIYHVVAVLSYWFGLPSWVLGSALVLLAMGLPVVLVTALAQTSGPTTARSSPPRSSTVFTWSKTIGTGVVAFAVLGLSSAGFMGMRTLGIGPVGTLVAKGILPEGSRLLVGEFSAPAADSALAVAVAEGLRINLSRSGILRIVGRAEAHDGLRRVGHEPEEPLTGPVARDLAVREGITSLLVGELAPVGDGYRISTRLLSPDSGDVLLRVTEMAGSTDEVLVAVDRVSTKIRERAGESLKSVRASQPLARTVTPSIEALKLYALARRAADLRDDDRSAALLLEQAIERDPRFKLAWRKLDSVLRELGDDRQSVEIYERLVVLRPDFWRLHDNLGHAHARRGDFERAADSFQRAVEADSMAHTLGYLVTYRIATGDIRGARAAMAARLRLFPADEANRFGMVSILYAEGNLEGAERITRAGVAGGSAVYRASHLAQLANLRERAGRIEEGRRLRAAAAEILDELGRSTTGVYREIPRAWIDVFVMGRSQAAARRLAGVARPGAMEELDTVDRPYLALAGTLAVVGEAELARSLLEEWREVTPEGLRRRDAKLADWAEGLTLVAEGATDAGLARLRSGTRETIGANLSLPTLAWAYDVAGRADSALAAYRAFERLDHPGRIFADAIFLAHSYERMARIYEDRDDPARAAEYYRKFVDIWAEADPELQPRVTAARRALDALTGAGRTSRAAPSPGA